MCKMPSVKSVVCRSYTLRREMQAMAEAKCSVALFSMLDCVSLSDNCLKCDKRATLKAAKYKMLWMNLVLLLFIQYTPYSGNKGAKVNTQVVVYASQPCLLKWNTTTVETVFEKAHAGWTSNAFIMLQQRVLVKADMWRCCFNAILLG